MSKIGILTAAALLVVSSEALAQEKGCAEAYNVGKDIARLDAEVQAMKKLLTQLLELDRKRTALLARAVGGEGVSLEALAPLTDAPTSATKTTSPKRSRRRSGTVKGRVKGGGSGTYVYLDDIEGRLVRGKTVTVKQLNRQFAPRWAVVQRGTTVKFPNEDSTYHNVFSNSPYAKFDLGIYRKGDAAKSYRFTRAGLIEVHCNMHAKMSTEILVVPSHHYTRAKKDGSFTLPRVPPGRHHVRAWSFGKQVAEAWVDVPAGGGANVELTLVTRKAGRHLNKDGVPYGSYK